MRTVDPGDISHGRFGLIARTGNTHPVILLLGWILVAAGVALTIRLALTAGRPHEIGSDFGFLWLAGKMWLAGQDPYQTLFAVQAAHEFSQTHGWSFVHPPQWWPIVTPLGALSFEAATHVWRAGSVLCLFATGALLWFETKRWNPPVSTLLRLVFLIVLFSTEKIGAVFYLDQTGLLTLLGFAFLIIGARPGKLIVSTCGFIILMGKPSLGLPIVVIGLASAEMRRGLFCAGVVTAIACLPQFSGGIAEGFHRAAEFLHNIAGYNAPGTWNAPDKMNGLYHIVPGIPSFVALGLSGVVGLLLYWRFRQLDPNGDPGPAFLLAGASTLASIAPIHTYDLPFVLCIVLLLGRMRREAAIPAAIGLILLHSAKRFARFEIPESEALAVGQAHLDSLGGVLVLASALVTATRGWRSVRIAPVQST